VLLLERCLDVEGCVEQKKSEVVEYISDTLAHRGSKTLHTISMSEEFLNPSAYDCSCTHSGFSRAHMYMH
jgi:hypothetical protein